MKGACIMFVCAALVASAVNVADAAQAAPQENAILAQLQGSSTSNNGQGGNSGGVFSQGFAGSNGHSLASQLQQQILAAPPAEKATVAGDLGAYGVPLPAPGPAFLSAITSLQPNDQQNLFSTLVTDFTSPAAGPVQQAASSTNTDSVGFGTMGVQSSSGSRKLMQFA